MEFWDELCGNTLARSLAITDASPRSLKRFDTAYLELYPYLLEHVRPQRMKDKRVLEIGLGFGTLGQRIAEEGADYVGMDIASNPVAMMRHRLRLASSSGQAVQADFLDNDLDDASFDFVVAVGCFHHTGDVPKCVRETHRLLRPGGTAVIMVYNRFSLRQWLRWPVATFRALLGANSAADEAQRGAYDLDAAGKAAPVTEFSSIKDLKRIFRGFSRARFKRENFDDFQVRGVRVLPRKPLLFALGPFFGLDIYVEARSRAANPPPPQAPGSCQKDKN